MRGPSKSTSVASIGFILISIVVLGGMAWVTVSTFELAKKNVGEEHDRKVSLAVGRIEKYTGGVLNSETYRSFFGLERPGAIGGVFVDERGRRRRGAGPASVTAGDVRSAARLD